MVRVFAAALLALVAGDAVLASEPAGASGPVYELRVYTCEPGKLPALEERFRDHTLRLFEKHGMKNLGYWNPVSAEGENNALIYLLEYPSREAAVASWEGFRSDPEWQAVAAASQEKHGKILAKPPGSTYLKAIDFSPEVSLPTAGKHYELRTYIAAPGKFEAMNERFRKDADRLLRKHGMNSIGYWVPTDAPESETTLIYVLEFDSPEAARKSWASFFADPEWQQVYAESEKNGTLLSKTPDSVYLNVSPVSPLAK
ncbi:NIPSNAP family protein [Planctomicrobium sp. SH668]|uniref:NIPSNAP family protein n=1 Tax=Planctomicrobium sp. SH668 TaxID=3448126 RepID=UPI003F5B70B3